MQSSKDNEKKKVGYRRKNLINCMRCQLGAELAVFYHQSPLNQLK